MAEKMGEFLKADLPSQFDAAVKEQQDVLNALQSSELNKLKNVIGVGVGYQYREGKQTEDIGPIVYVSRKLPLSELKPEEIIPKSIAISGEEQRVDVIKISPIVPACRFGIPDTQHAEFDRVPPGVAICGYNPSTGKILNKAIGTGGAIVQSLPNGEKFLLTNKHVIPAGSTVGQPWKIHKVGLHVATAKTLDAAICKIDKLDPTIHCFDKPVSAPVAPLIGWAVKKSGAATGVTGSYLLAFVKLRGYPSKLVLINNAAKVPQSKRPCPYPYPIEVFVRVGQAPRQQARRVVEPHHDEHGGDLSTVYRPRPSISCGGPFKICSVN